MMFVKRYPEFVVVFHNCTRVVFFLVRLMSCCFICIPHHIGGIHQASSDFLGRLLCCSSCLLNKKRRKIFWLKMVFLCIFGAASLFPTVTFIKRSVAIQQGKELEPMSEKLASRLQQVLNAELVMLASIPLAATTMVSSFILLSILLSYMHATRMCKDL